MDNITLIGIIGSVMSIISFFLTMFSPSSKTNISSNNRISINKCFNNNSFNTITNNVNVIYKLDLAEKGNQNRTGYSDENYNSYDYVIFLFIAILIMGAVISFYITYRKVIVFWIAVLGIVLLCINCILLLIINKRMCVPKLYLYFNTLKWIPLFIMLIFIYKPFYKSSTFIKVKMMLRNTNNFLNVFQNYHKDVMFIIFQILGLFFISIVMILYIYMILRDLRKSIKYLDYNVKQVKVNDIIINFIIMMIFFFVVSGLIIKVFYKF